MNHLWILNWNNTFRRFIAMPKKLILWSCSDWLKASMWRRAFCHMTKCWTLIGLGAETCVHRQKLPISTYYSIQCDCKITICHHLSSSTYLSSYVIIHHHLSSYICHHLSSFVIICHHLSSSVIIFHHTSSTFIIHHHLSSSVIICHLSHHHPSVWAVLVFRVYIHIYRDYPDKTTPA